MCIELLRCCKLTACSLFAVVSLSTRSIYVFSNSLSLSISIHTHLFNYSFLSTRTTLTNSLLFLFVFLLSSCIQEFNLLAVAQWEKSTNQKIKMGRVQQQFAHIKQSHEEVLHERRRRLAALLAEEEEQYKHEIAAMEETPEERQEKMRARAKALRYVVYAFFLGALSLSFQYSRDSLLVLYFLLLFFSGFVICFSSFSSFFFSFVYLNFALFL